MPITLLCTVGGSHQPIVKAIETLRPGRVCFICSDDDPATKIKGSYTQITGKGYIIKAHVNDDKPTLPNIPAQTGLSEEQFEILKVAADDFDDSYAKIIAWIDRRAGDDERLVADYTGGTKTMSAALAVAALDSEQVELQLVSGSRGNLIKVEPGSEVVIPASVEASRFHRRLQSALASWRRFAYEEAVAAMESLPPPQDQKLRGHYHRALAVSRALAAWDRFDHHAALRGLDPYRSVIGPALRLHLMALKMLTEGERKQHEPMQLIDLWLNARRRAAQGRYDDAMARIYRLLEWTAQWQLRLHAGIETADIPAEKIPADLTLAQNREGQYQAGLYQAWQLLGSLLDNEAARFFGEQKDRMLEQLRVRNRSILAHGFQPIGREQWRATEEWMNSAFIPLLKTLARKEARIDIGIDRLQLPDDYAKLEGME